MKLKCSMCFVLVNGETCGGLPLCYACYSEPERMKEFEKKFAKELRQFDKDNFLWEFIPEMKEYYHWHFHNAIGRIPFTFIQWMQMHFPEMPKEDIQFGMNFY